MHDGKPRPCVSVRPRRLTHAATRHAVHLALLAVVVACGRSSDRRDGPTPTEPARAPVTPDVRDVRGRLVWQTPRYRLLVASTDGGQEVALDLWISENKILVRQLEELRDKEVIVTGDVVRVPKGSTIGSDADDTKGFSDFAIRRAR